MRRPYPATLLAACVLAAGCLGAAEPAGDAADTPAAAARLSLDAVPPGAEVELLAEGLRLVWRDAALPFRAEVAVPEGATAVRLSTVVAPGAQIDRVSVWNSETGRRRCDSSTLETWNTRVSGTASCTALTALDALPAAWTAEVRARADVGLVQLDLLTTPLEGPAALLDLSRLSMREHAMRPTESFMVVSHDGVRLNVEVTLPDAPGPFPAILVSGPYHQGQRAAGIRPYDDAVRDWGERGYALVVADVRGFGESEGCVEVWGPNEQKDQVALVEWIAAQPWSDGNVGMYGESYVGTTAVEAAVRAPSALKAVVALEAVVDAYNDWHFGGVPNGERLTSAPNYQAMGTTAQVRAEDPAATAMRWSNGACDATLAARANDPRALYDGYYAARNFSVGAPGVTAAVLYGQGFIDLNVKSAMIPEWFNHLPGPKLGLLGPWGHHHPVRADAEVLYLAWFDQYLKGKPMGLERLPRALVESNLGDVRAADAWPPLDAAEERFLLDVGESRLARRAPSGRATLLLAPAQPAGAPPPPGASVAAATLLPRGLRVAGAPHVELVLELHGADNAHVAALVFDRGPHGDWLVTWGAANLAHRFGHDRYEAVAPGETVRTVLPLLPTEYVLEPGHELVLVVRGAGAGEPHHMLPRPAAASLVGGEGGTTLVLPTLALEA